MAKVLELKSLTFVRHSYAVASSEFPGSDGDRPLTEKGTEAARALDQALASSVPPPDLILVSDALRAQQTLHELVQYCAGKPEIKALRELYDCSAGQLYNIILENQAGRAHLCVIGHNPAVSQLYSMLSGEYCALSPAQSRTLLLEDK